MENGNPLFNKLDEMLKRFTDSSDKNLEANNGLIKQLQVLIDKPTNLKDAPEAKEKLDLDLMARIIRLEKVVFK